MGRTSRVPARYWRMRGLRWGRCWCGLGRASRWGVLPRRRARGRAVVGRAELVRQLGAADVHVNKFHSVVSVTVPASVVEKKLATALYHHSHEDYPESDAVRAAGPPTPPGRPSV